MPADRAARRLTFCAEERRVFKAQDYGSVSQWAARNLIVQDGLFKGSPLRLDVSPFLAKPMDSFSTLGVEEVGVCGSLQLGKTLFLYACLGYSIVARFGNRMLAMPTNKSLEKVVERKVAPLLNGSPALRKRLRKKIRRSGADFADGTGLLFASAETPSDRASMTIQDLFLDEEDLYMPGASSASPVEDLLGRTRSSGWQRKVARACQPKGEKSSIFAWVTQRADQLFCYELRCPACQEYHLPDMANLAALENCTAPGEIRLRRLARYRCACGYLWSDHVRDLAVRGGRWRPYSYTPEGGFRPAAPVPGARSHGYHAPAILSRFVSLSDLLARKLEAAASDDPSVIQSYYNDDLALPYTPVVIQSNEEQILTRREPLLPPRHCPPGTVALTCGLDMQKRGFWYLVRAWQPDLRSYVIDYGSLESWEQVSALAFDTWYPVLAPDFSASTGEVLPIWRAALDTGGTRRAEEDVLSSRTEEAYLWVAANGGGVIQACKGASHEQLATVRRVVRERSPYSGRPIPGGLILYMLDTNALKTLAFSRLLNPESPHQLRLHADCGPDLAAHLSAERQVRKAGRLVWEQSRGLNHLTDCLMLSEAAAHSTWTPSLPHYLLQLEQAARAAQAPQPMPKRKERPEPQRRWG